MQDSRKSPGSHVIGNQRQERNRLSASGRPGLSAFSLLLRDVLFGYKINDELCI
jgi:hypothetical protein